MWLQTLQQPGHASELVEGWQYACLVLREQRLILEDIALRFGHPEIAVALARRGGFATCQHRVVDGPAEGRDGEIRHGPNARAQAEEDQRQAGATCCRDGMIACAKQLSGQERESCVGGQPAATRQLP